MMEDTVRHIKQCGRCLRFKATPDKAPMENVDATYPMELVHMDYLTIEANEGGKCNIVKVVQLLRNRFRAHRLYTQRIVSKYTCMHNTTQEPISN